MILIENSEKFQCKIVTRLMANYGDGRLLLNLSFENSNYWIQELEYLKMKRMIQSKHSELKFAVDLLLRTSHYFIHYAAKSWKQKCEKI